MDGLTQYVKKVLAVSKLGFNVKSLNISLVTPNYDFVQWPACAIYYRSWEIVSVFA